MRDRMADDGQPRRFHAFRVEEGCVIEVGESVDVLHCDRERVTGALERREHFLDSIHATDGLFLAENIENLAQIGAAAFS